MRRHRPAQGLTLLLPVVLWIFCHVSGVHGALPTTRKLFFSVFLKWSSRAVWVRVGMGEKQTICLWREAAQVEVYGYVSSAGRQRQWEAEVEAGSTFEFKPKRVSALGSVVPLFLAHGIFMTAEMFNCVFFRRLQKLLEYWGIVTELVNGI